MIMNLKVSKSHLRILLNSVIWAGQTDWQLKLKGKSRKDPAKVKLVMAFHGEGISLPHSSHWVSVTRLQAPQQFGEIILTFGWGKGDSGMLCDLSKSTEYVDNQIQATADPSAQLDALCPPHHATLCQLSNNRNNTAHTATPCCKQLINSEKTESSENKHQNASPILEKRFL